MSAWTKQKAWQVKKLGAEKASWYCEWNEPDGTRRAKSCGAGPKGKRNAQRMAERIKAELLTGTYNREGKKTWAKFRGEYERRILPHMKHTSADQYRCTLDRFEKLCKPKIVNTIAKRDIDKFLEKRRKERGRKPGSKVSTATLNRDLGNLRSILKIALGWEYIQTVPKIKLLKVPRRLPNYVTGEHFAAMYGKCDVAQSPAGLSCDAADWWRGLLVMAQMTGWRIGELLSLKWTDVDLDEGTAITRAEDNKGNRTEKIALHPVVIDHLLVLRRFDELVFPWPKSRRQLYEEFNLIQDEAEIWIPCNNASDPNHGECTDACHRYGFHDERRAFATMNAEHMTREALQALMRHKDASTTDLYINYARQVNPAVANLHVPQILRPDTA